MNARGADTRPVLSVDRRMSLDVVADYARTGWLGLRLGSQIGELIDGLVERGADPTTLHVEVHRDGSAPHLVVRATARNDTP